MAAAEDETAGTVAVEQAAAKKAKDRKAAAAAIAEQTAAAKKAAAAKQERKRRRKKEKLAGEGDVSNHAVAAKAPVDKKTAEKAAAANAANSPQRLFKSTKQREFSMILSQQSFSTEVDKTSP